MLINEATYYRLLNLITSPHTDHALEKKEKIGCKRLKKSGITAN